MLPLEKFLSASICKTSPQRQEPRKEKSVSSIASRDVLLYNFIKIYIYVFWLITNSYKNLR